MKYTFKESQEPDRWPIDFKVLDEDGNEVAQVWGNNRYDFEIDCNHSEVDFGDEDIMGECAICGAFCKWHNETDVVNEGYDSDGQYYAQEGKVPVIDEWDFDFKQFDSDCVITEYMKTLKECKK